MKRVFDLDACIGQFAKKPCKLDQTHQTLASTPRETPEAPDAPEAQSAAQKMLHQLINGPDERAAHSTIPKQSLTVPEETLTFMRNIQESTGIDAPEAPEAQSAAQKILHELINGPARSALNDTSGVHRHAGVLREFGGVAGWMRSQGSS